MNGHRSQRSAGEPSCCHAKETASDRKGMKDPPPEKELPPFKLYFVREAKR